MISTAMRNACGDRKIPPPNIAASASLRPCAANQPNASPSPPPINIISIDSAITIPSTVLSLKPTVLSTANSDMRSRTDCAIVLPVTSNRVKKTAARISCTISAMSPSCSMKERANASSVLVLVSLGELANSASTAFATSTGFAPSFSMIVYQPTRPCPPARASSK